MTQNSTPEKKSVIICDDNDDILEVVSKVVRDAGHEVFTAHGSAELMPLVELVHPDLLVCDIRMPGKDGLEIAEQLHKRDASLPIVLMTAYNPAFYRAYSTYVGVSDVLKKPLDYDNLLKQIDAVLAKRDSHQDTGT